MYERTKLGVWLMYLRKSRQDNPNETVEEVLAKHEVQLQEHAVRELGGRIPEENIYREVISGESIDEREEMQKVLARIEDSSVVGVLVIDPQRLSRGDLLDCGRLINALRFTRTQVCTPIMTYDLENKMDRKFFQDELLRGRDYLEYTKEILFRGRVAAAKRGCYTSAPTPYGYNKIKIGKDHTLVPNESAPLVLSMYEWYVHDGMTPGDIVRRLNEMEIPGPAGGKWQKKTVQFILKNPLYIGKICFNKRKSTPILEDGEVLIKRLPSSPEDIITVEGKHPAIVDTELWESSQELFKRAARTGPKPEMRNPLSGIVTCSCCGYAMGIHPYKDTEDRFECRSRPRCYRSVKQSLLIDKVIFSLEHSELPELEHRLKRGDDTKKQQRDLTKLEKQMQEYRDQEDKQFEMLEIGIFSMDVFEQNHSALQEKMDLCQKQLLDVKKRISKKIDYSEVIAKTKNAIELLKDPTVKPEVQNRALKQVVKKILYTGEKSTGQGRQGLKISENNFSIKIELVD